MKKSKEALSFNYSKIEFAFNKYKNGINKNVLKMFYIINYFILKNFCFNIISLKLGL